MLDQVNDDVPASGKIHSGGQVTTQQKQGRKQMAVGQQTEKVFRPLSAAGRLLGALVSGVAGRGDITICDVGYGYAAMMRLEANEADVSPAKQDRSPALPPE